jgi:hypothetical protein
VIGYAKSLCGSLRSEYDIGAVERRNGKLFTMKRIAEVIELFRNRCNLEGIAQIMKHLPREYEYADLASKG